MRKAITRTTKGLPVAVGAALAVTLTAAVGTVATSTPRTAAAADAVPVTVDVPATTSALPAEAAVPSTPPPPTAPVVVRPSTPPPAYVAPIPTTVAAVRSADPAAVEAVSASDDHELGSTIRAHEGGVGGTPEALQLGPAPTSYGAPAAPKAAPAAKPRTTTAPTTKPTTTMKKTTATKKTTGTTSTGSTPARVPTATPRTATPKPATPKPAAPKPTPAPTKPPSLPAACPSAPPTTRVYGMDVSGHQGDVDWASAARNGGRFVYVKATESTTYRNPYFAGQYAGSCRAGLVRGAYHFALPNRSSGRTQADYFVRNGGDWSADGSTLPPMLDIEYNPYSGLDTCYGLSDRQMSNWVADFSNRVHTLTGRYPTIYTTTNWWATCTGNTSRFGATNPLFIARYNNTVGQLPRGWSTYTLWQYNDRGKFPGDQDFFNGSMAGLRRFALGR